MSVAGAAARRVAAPDDRHLAALALVALDGMSPRRLARLLDAYGDPRRALAAATGAPTTGRALVRDADDLRTRCARRGTRVWIDGDDDYPIRDAIPDRPRVLLGEGSRPDALDAPRVAIVGTRQASPQGLADARELGAFLADAGVTVVSGLAVGVDAAAHEGALDAGGHAVGVVATGLDVTYPRRHRALYERVRGAGVVVSEHAYGVPPRPERFPVRNRIIAALADAVVVVEATVHGGARITAERAAEYGRPVLALPGSRRNPAARGCNALIADGALCLLDPGDVLLALGRGDTAPWRAPPLVTHPHERAVLDALAGEAATTDQLVDRTGLGPAAVAAAIRRLQQAGAVAAGRGRWWPC